MRAPGEWQERRIDPAVNRPLSGLIEQMATVPDNRSIVVYCTSGYRSAIAASLLQREGYPAVADLVGGLPAWEARVPVSS